MRIVSASRGASIELLESRRLFAAAPGFVQSEYVDELSRPVAIAFSPDGRLFIAQQGGDLRVVKDGVLLPQPALSLDVNDAGERGMIGIAFDPAFEQNGFVYLHYTTPGPAVHNRVSRFTVSGDTVDPATEQALIDLPNLGATNHNGGALDFGPDGKLYIGVGDNASSTVSQRLNTPLGKLLRINPDGTIPEDNPFIADTTGLSQSIWALGLRNPFTFAFRSDGKLLINDVGQSDFEEINVGSAAANFGWSIIEGKRTNEAAPTNYVDPLLAYGPGGGPFSGAAITGAAFVETPAGVAAALPAALQGDFLFADFGDGFVRAIDPATKELALLATGLNTPVGLAVGPDGAAYVLEHFAGRVVRLATAPADLAITFRTEPPALAVQNGKAKAQLLINNVGGATVRGKANVRLVASADAVADPSDLLLTEADRRVSLRAGQSKPLNVRFNWPSDLDASVQIVATLSSIDERISDTDVSNNTAASASTVRVAPPFVDLSLAFRETTVAIAATARRQRVVLDVRNEANASFNGRTGIEISVTSESGGPATAITSVSRPLRIKVDASKPLVLRIALPEDLPPAAYNLQAVITPTGPDADVDPDNNDAAVPLLVA